MKKEALIEFVKKIPGVYQLYLAVNLLYALIKHRSIKTLLFAPPGHYYSPLPDLKAIKENRKQIFLQHDPLLGLDIGHSRQIDLLKTFRKHYADMPFQDKPNRKQRYYFSNGLFSYSDAIILYSFIRHFKPKRIIEVGSGFSSAVMLDTSDQFFNNKIDITFIDPFPKRLKRLLSELDRSQYRIIAKPVQSVPTNLFVKLNKDDILFIDSSHVSKIGSDVNHLIFKILPILNPGVIIHFHDIPWPFVYPEKWVFQGRAWNEAYLLRAFMQYNEAFEILYHNSYMGHCCEKEVADMLPLCLKNIGGSIWLRKVRP